MSDGSHFAQSLTKTRCSSDGILIRLFFYEDENKDHGDNNDDVDDDDDDDDDDDGTVDCITAIQKITT